MFDFLLGFTALVHSAITTLDWACATEFTNNPNKPDNLKGDYERSVEIFTRREVQQKPLLEQKRKTVKAESPSERKRREYVEREAARRVAQRHANDGQEPQENALATWVMNNDQLVLECLKPGKHIIPNSAMVGMNEETIANWLFAKIEAVESVDRIPAGLEVTVR